MTTVRTRKKLIEVALPLDAINRASAWEKGNPFIRDHPRNIHHWWARRPHSAARAIIFAQLVDDPSGVPEEFPTPEAQRHERNRLFSIIEELVKWENSTNHELLDRVQKEIRRSWLRTCNDNLRYPNAHETFNPDQMPDLHDPFAGGGTIPAEAARLGLRAIASDLNPVAVLINKAMIEIPPRVAGQPPVNPRAQAASTLFSRTWEGVDGLVDDIRYYAQVLRDQVLLQVGHMYPRVTVTPEMASATDELRQYVGQKLNVISWNWARTVRSPNPAFADTHVPLVSTFYLSTRSGAVAFVEPVTHGTGYRFEVRYGAPTYPDRTRAGTRAARGANFRCILSGTPIAPSYIRAEAQAGRMGTRLMAIVAEGDRRRVFLPPVEEHEVIAKSEVADWRPDVEFLQSALGFRIGNYGMSRWSDIFTERQLIVLGHLTRLIPQVAELVREDVAAAQRRAGTAPGAAWDADTYSTAISVYLACAVSQISRYCSTLAKWNVTNANLGQVFGLNALPMVWDFAEPNTAQGALDITRGADWVATALTNLVWREPGRSEVADARIQTLSKHCVVSTDPPYYDNVGYADLSDYFYVWLRRSMQTSYPQLFGTVAVPKSDELVATPARHGGREAAETFFEEGATRALAAIADQSHPAFPTTIYYAFRQVESANSEAPSSTGWETFLSGLTEAGFSVVGTWPIRTERQGRLRETDSNALASSIVLVCRPRAADAESATRRMFVAALKAELPEALAHLQAGNIAPVDLAQAAIGPGMAVYSRYAKVLGAEGKPMGVREALALINQTLDETLADQEGDFDADTRWALTWFEQQGFVEGEYGTAETLATARNTSVHGLVEAKIVVSARGRVRLLAPSELPPDWDPAKDRRLTHWDAVHHLIRVLESDGEPAAAELIRKLGSKAEAARELAYRLYTICERKNRAKEALSYNGLVQSWPEMLRLAQAEGHTSPTSTPLFGEA